MTILDSKRTRVRDLLDSSLSAIQDCFGALPKYSFKGNLLPNSATDLPGFVQMKRDLANGMPGSPFWEEVGLFPPKIRFDPAHASKQDLLEAIACTTLGIPLQGKAARDEAANAHPADYQELMETPAVRLPLGLTINSSSPAAPSPENEISYPPKAFYEFIDGIDNFSKGGAVPSAAVLNEGLGFIKTVLAIAKQDLTQTFEQNDKSPPADTQAEAFRAQQLFTHLVKEANAPVPEYMPSEIRSSLKRLRTQWQNCETADDFDLAHNAIKEAGEDFVPYYARNGEVTAQDIKLFGDHEHFMEAKSINQLQVLEYAYQTCQDLVNVIGVSRGAAIRGAKQ